MWPTRLLILILLLLLLSNRALERSSAGRGVHVFLCSLNQEQDRSQTHTMAASDDSARPAYAPAAWGFAQWVGLDFTVRGLPRRLDAEQWEDMREYIRSLRTALPCGGCRVHYREFLEKHAGELRPTRSSIRQFFRGVDNHVRTSQGKAARPDPGEDVEPGLGYVEAWIRQRREHFERQAGMATEKRAGGGGVVSAVLAGVVGLVGGVLLAGGSNSRKR